MKRTLYIVVGAIVLLGGGYLIYTLTSGNLNKAYKVELFVPDETSDTCGYEYTIDLSESNLSLCSNTNLNYMLRQGGGVEVYNGVLDLTRMRFSKLPTVISEHNCIKILNANRNCLTAFPTDVFKIKQLKELNLSANNISRFPTVKEKSAIEILNLDNNNISSINGKDIAQFTKLKRLQLRGNTGLSALPKEIEKMKHIEIVDIRDTELAKDRKEVNRLYNALMPETKLYYYSKKKKK